MTNFSLCSLLHSSTNIPPQRLASDCSRTLPTSRTLSEALCSGNSICSQRLYLRSGEKSTSELALTRFTVSGVPIPLDPSGDEMCLLFIKYGRCRYRKKCRKSHWVPPLPDEDFPLPPPLPSSPPPLASGADQSGTSIESSNSSERKHISISIDLGNDVKCKQTENYLSSIPEVLVHGRENSRSTVDTTARSSDGKLVAPLSETRVSYVSSASANVDVALPKASFPTSVPQRDLNITDTARYTSYIEKAQFVADSEMEGSLVSRDIEAEVRSHDSQDPPNLVLETPKHGDPSMDLLIKKACQGKSRFDNVFPSSVEAMGPGSTYKSSISEQYKKMGAYFDRQTGKLEAKKIPRTKPGRKYFKLFKRIHWRTCQSLREKLATSPAAYLLTVNLARVDFNRLRPYMYLLVHRSFSMEPCLSRKPSVFSCLVADTLIALFEYKNISPTQAEQKLCECGVRPVRARQCMSHLWNIIAKSSLAENGVAPEVVKCERDVYRAKISALDYAFACSIAVKHAKAQSAETEAKLLRVSQSVKRGLKAISLREADGDSKKRLSAGQQPKETAAGSLGFVATRNENVRRLESTKFTSENVDNSKGVPAGLKDILELNPLVCDTTQATERTAAQKEVISQRCLRDGLEGVSAHDRTDKAVESSVRESLLVSAPAVQIQDGAQSSTGFPPRKRRKRSRQFKGLGGKEKADLVKRFRKMVDENTVK